MTGLALNVQGKLLVWGSGSGSGAEGLGGNYRFRVLGGVKP